MPEMPAGAEQGIVRGMYLLREAPASASAPRVQLLGSGTILREALAAAEALEADFGVHADVWSVTSFTELKREGDAVRRHAMLHPMEPAGQSYVERCLGPRKGPVVAATDYLRAYADQIRAFVPRRYSVLGTDGFGRSDIRPSLRNHFEVDSRFIALAALHALAEEGAIERGVVAKAVQKYGIDPDKRDPAKP
jgi:pyruvate dehydrogenase E1 component